MYEKIIKKMLARNRKTEKTLKEIKSECYGFSFKDVNINFTLPCETNGWQPIETFYKDSYNDDVLILVEGIVCIGRRDGTTDLDWYARTICFYEQRSRIAYKYQGLGEEPTHWMPLPKPPKEEENESSKK